MSSVLALAKAKHRARPTLWQCIMPKQPASKEPICLCQEKVMCQFDVWQCILIISKRKQQRQAREGDTEVEILYFGVLNIPFFFRLSAHPFLAGL